MKREFDDKEDDEKSDDLQIDESKIVSRPVVVGDIKEMFFNIDNAMDVYHALDGKSQEKLWPVLAMAIDVACSTCYELGFETPEEITESDYFFRTVKPEEMK